MLWIYPAYSVFLVWNHFQVVVFALSLPIGLRVRFLSGNRKFFKAPAEYHINNKFESKLSRIKLDRSSYSSFSPYHQSNSGLSHSLLSHISPDSKSTSRRSFSLNSMTSASKDQSQIPLHDNESISLPFDNANIRKLPMDMATEERSSRPVRDAIFSRISPEPVTSPALVAASSEALKLIGIQLPNNVSDQGHIAMTESQIADYFSGNKLFHGSEPASHCYAGHQFGSFAGQLGDGTVIYLGEVINENNQRWEVQLKGAGRTPYSRSSDGRKVLRSSIREFLASEAMHALKIPTTRAGTCVTSESTVDRDPLYNGNVIAEQCTIVSRIAPNFFRFGSFEIFKSGPRSGPSAGNTALKEQLLDHIISYWPDIASLSPALKYKEWFKRVVLSTAALVAHWQAVGWVHGVLNTDNMSVMGLTIDYGPYAFMEAYDEDFTPNGSDGSARYAYDRQPEICKWNLLKLSEAVDPLLSMDEGRAIVSELYDKEYDSVYHDIMSRKLGLDKSFISQSQQAVLINILKNTMTKTHADYTDTFQALTLLLEDLQNPSNKDAAMATALDRLVSRCSSPSDVVSSIRRKMQISRLSMHPQELQQLWTLLQEDENKVADLFVGADVKELKQEIEAEKKKLDRLMASANEMEKFKVMNIEDKRTFDRERWQAWLKVYYETLSKNHAFEESLDASQPAKSLAKRVEDMRLTNPTFILRNWILQDAIEAATSSASSPGDYSHVRDLLMMIQTPYDQRFSTFSKESNSTESYVQRYCKPPPSWAPSLVCTCSS